MPAPRRPSVEHFPLPDLTVRIPLQDHYPIEQMANFNCERIPERQPHAKGAVRLASPESPMTLSAYTRAAVFQPGVKTEMFARLSTVAGERAALSHAAGPAWFSMVLYNNMTDGKL